MSVRVHVALVSGFCALAVAQALPDLDRSLWFDEAATVRVALVPAREIWGELAYEGGNMGAYLVAMRAWILPGIAEAWIRVPSLLATVATVPVLFAIGRRVDPRVGLAAAGLFAVHPLAGRYAVEARSYAPFTLSLTLAWLALFHATDGDRRAWRVWAAFLVGSAWLQLVAPLHWLAQLAWLATRPASQRPRRAVAEALALVGAGCLPLAVLVPQRAAGLGWIRDLAPAQVATITADLAGDALPGAVAVVVAGWIGALVGTLRGRASPDVLASGLWLVVPAAALTATSVFHPMLVSRYLLPCVPGGCLLMASWATRAHTRAWQGLGVVALVVVGAWNMAHPREFEEDWRSAFERVFAEAERGDVLLVFPPFTVNVAHYYWRRAGHPADAPDLLFPSAPWPGTGSAPRRDLAAALAVADDRERVFVVHAAGIAHPRLWARLRAHHPDVGEHHYRGVTLRRFGPPVARRRPGRGPRARQ